MATLVIATGVIVPTISFEIKRDREEELVHRGAQYSRAIRAFVKRTGRYPTRLEELQQSGGLKFLRKMYKDPITGEDFRLLHQADVMGIGNGIANLNSGSSKNSQGDTGSVDTPDASSANSNPDGDPNAQSGSQNNPASPGLGSQPTLRSIGTANTGAPQGLLIFGVASKSKTQTIREFDHKNHYKDWLFFYDPKYDRGREIKGPTSMSPLPDPQVGTPGQNLLPGRAPAAPNPIPTAQPEQQQ